MVILESCDKVFVWYGEGAETTERQAGWNLAQVDDLHFLRYILITWKHIKSVIEVNQPVQASGFTW